MAVKKSYHLFRKFSLATAMITAAVSWLILLTGCKKDKPDEPTTKPSPTWYIGSPDTLAVTAKLYPDNYSLVISGTGKMKSFGISNLAFWPTYLSKIEIKNGVTSIGDFAFFSCYRLTSISIPNSVISIGNGAFVGCYNLTSVYIPYNVTSIGDNAFEGCFNLTSVNIPNSVTSIGNLAFYACSKLASIDIPNSVKGIGSSVFENCESLTVINVDADNILYSSLGGVLYNKSQNTLIACPNGITHVTIPGSVTSIGDFAFSGCQVLNSVNIPNGVTNIGSFAFGSCGLTSITLPNSVTSIGSSAFGFCDDLTSVTIPNSVTNIGEYSFTYCGNLTSVTVQWDTPLSINADVFWNVKLSTATLRVPAGKITDYSTTAVWKDFGTILPISK